jgi:hypothetical protein
MTNRALIQMRVDMRPYVCVLVLTLGAALTTVAAQVKSGPLTLDLLVDIKHPSEPRWSPSGDAVAYLWDRGGVQNIWLAKTDGGPPTALTSFTSCSFARDS